MILREIEIKPTPEELAYCFSRMDSAQQAKFFDELDYWFDQFGGPQYLMQVCEIIARLSPVGRIFVFNLSIFLRDPVP